MDSHCCGQAASDYFTCREREGEWKGRRKKEEGREREGKEEEEKKERKGGMNEKFSAELLGASTYG